MKDILIVDDAPTIRYYLKFVLQSKGYNIVGEAEDGLDAVAKYKELKPDIVTMDIGLPILGGLAAVKQIIEYDPTAKIIIISSHDSPSLFDELKQIGIDEIIKKPFEEETVLSALRRFNI